MEKTKILIADDHRMVRQGLINLFSTHKKFEIIAETGSGQEAVQLALSHFPDIVIIKIGMPDLNGMEATKQILSKNSAIKIIALSVHTQKRYVMGMLNAGGSGYLLKSCPFQELITAIEVVLSGRIYLCHDISAVVVESALASEQNKMGSLFSLLSQREREILQLLSEGHKNKSIAEKLHISTKTVQVHRTNLKKKLNLNSTAELTKYAISKGLTSV
jgi:DNA-binding NarL/FixJ family response regulator